MSNNNKPYGIVYKCINLHNNKIYIGTTTLTLEERLAAQFASPNNALYEDAQKYGRDAFACTVINECQTKAHMYETKKKLIQSELDRGLEYGTHIYNKKRDYSGHNPNLIPSKQTRKRMAISRSKITSPYVIYNPNGRKYTFYNQNEFAKQHGLSQSHLSKMLRGETPAIKGWTLTPKETTVTSQVTRLADTQRKTRSKDGLYSKSAKRTYELTFQNGKTKLYREATLSDMETNLGISYRTFIRLLEDTTEGIKNNRLGVTNIKIIPPKEYSIFSPDGVLHTFANLQDFADEHGLSISGLSKTLRGKQKHTAGWYVKKIRKTRKDKGKKRTTTEVVATPVVETEVTSKRKPYTRTNPDVFEIYDPNGKKHTGSNQREFCEKHGLSQGPLSQVLRGILPATKGWYIEGSELDKQMKMQFEEPTTVTVPDTPVEKTPIGNEEPKLTRREALKQLWNSLW